jgi:hypothetical protein
MPLTDGACTNFIENFRENSLKQDLSNGTTVNPPNFSLVNTFKLSRIVQVGVWVSCTAISNGAVDSVSV